MLEGHGLPAPRGLIRDCGAIDIGPGIRPAPWFARKQLCVEPYGPYADRLRAAGYPVAQQTALEFLTDVDVRGLVVVLLDVLEHMEKDVGRAVLRLLEPALQVVVFTPYGFLPQSHDAWGLGGEHWQTHRSGWEPHEFPGWQIERYPHDGTFSSFFAVRP